MRTFQQAPVKDRDGTQGPPSRPETDVPALAGRSTLEVLADSALAAMREVTVEAGRLIELAAANFAPPVAVSLVQSLFGAPRGRATAIAGPVADLESRLAEADAALANEIERATAAHGRAEEALRDLEGARARERALRAELAAALEREAASARRTEELVAAAESARISAVRDAEATRHAAGEARRNAERLASEDERLRAKLADANERITTFEADAARALDEHRRLERQLESERAAAETHWQEERARLEGDHLREHERAQAIEEELERRRLEIEQLERREKRLREQLQAAGARSEADREETLRHAREIVQAAEEDRAAAAAELEAMRGALVAEQARLLEIQHERKRATQGAAERAAELASTREVMGQLEASRAATAAELERTRAALTQAESDLLASQHDLRLSQAHLDKLCNAHDDMVEDRARFEVRLKEASEREARLRLRLTDLESRVQTLRTAGAGPTTATRSDDGAARLTSELGEARERIPELEHALQVTRRDVTAHELAVRDALGRAAAAEHDEESTSNELERVRVVLTSAEAAARDAELAARSARVEHVAAVPFVPTWTEPPLAPAADDFPAADPPLEPVEPEDVAVASVAWPEEADASEVRDDPPAREEPPASEAIDLAPEPAADDAVAVSAPLVVLDASGAWEKADVLAPNPEAVERVREIAPGACVVNLAAPGAIATAVALRVAKLDVPLWGCIVASEAPGGAVVGRFEVLARPVDPAAVHAQLGAIAPPSARVVAVGSDAGVLLPLRQGLSKAGISVRTAWDFKQAAMLVDAAMPDVVVLDLAQPAVAAAEFVARLLPVETPPLLVLVPGAAKDLDEFAGALLSFAARVAAPSRIELLDAARAGR